jgi:hypothetical protein
MAPLLRFAIAAATSTAIILLLTFGTYSLHLWAGGHLSVRDFILRSFVLFPIVIGLVAGMWTSPRGSCPPPVAGATGAVIGLAYGYFAPRVVFSYGMGHWVGFGRIDRQIDLAALLCAVVAGTCAMLLSITARSRLVIVTAVILVLTAVLLPAPTFDLINHNQELTVAFVVPYSAGAVTNKPYVVADVYSTPVDVDTVTNRVLGLLRDQGITDQYRVSDLCRDGHGKQVLAVVVVNQPIVSKVQLQEPHGGDVIYLQQPDSWKKIPPQLPTLSRSITLEPPIAEDAIAGLTINGVGGWSTGFEIWKTAK